MTLPLPLHCICTRDTAIEAFSAASDPEFACDGQFASLPDAILAFISLDGTVVGSHAPRPSVVRWSMPDAQRNEADPYQWFPETVRETRDAAGKRTRHHHLFLRRQSSGLFVYCGTAHLGSYTALPRRQAEFELHNKLTRELWMEFGGFDGWEIEANHSNYHLRREDPGFAALLDALSSQEYSHLCMTRYEEDSLHLYLNPQRAWLMYLRYPEDTGLYLSPVESAGETVERFECHCGIDLEFPRSSTTTHEEAFAIVSRFFESGVVPEQLCWAI